MTNIVKICSTRLVQESQEEYDYKSEDMKLTNPEEVADIVDKVMHLKEMDVEHVVLLCMNTRNQVINMSLVSKGSLCESVVAPAQIFKTAILSNSAAVILVHNHPSGDTTPSGNDKTTTDRILEGGKVLGIQLLDHLIISSKGYFSFKENGLM